MKKFCKILSSLAIFATVFSCSSAEKTTGSYSQVKILADYVVEVPVYTKVDYEKGLSIAEGLFSKFGCSAIAKTLDNGDTIVGRSFDLQYSFNPAFIIKTAEEGYNKTIGLSYNVFDDENFHGDTFQSIKERGLSDEEKAFLPFFCVDVMNDKGLYIESNMREYEDEKTTGIKASTGTNPSSNIRLAFPCIGIYLSQRCSTVDEVLELLPTIDVHALKTDDHNWPGGFIIADSSGHYGLLELVDNKLVWSDMQNAQANFYIHKDYKDRAVMGMGYGRYDLLQSNIASVKNENDMKNLMNKVRYACIADADNCPFDSRSEFIGNVISNTVITRDYIFAEKNQPTIKALMLAKAELDKTKSIDVKRAEKTDWYSVWQTVANCNKKTLHVEFFEDSNLQYDLGFDF